MSFVLLCVLISATASFFFGTVCAVEYSDIEAMGVYCPQNISCVAIRNNLFRERNCECDRACILYNDCCIDARTRLMSRNNRRTNPPFCMAYGGQQIVGAYVVTTCNRNFLGPAEVQRMCQNHNNYSDPLMATPVTDTSSRITYRNSYCAECNNADMSSLQNWLIKMDCDAETLDVTDSFIWENLRYRPNLNMWGFDFDGRLYTCEMHFDKPTYLESTVRMCRPNVTSTCASNWTRMTVKRDCESYMAVMYTNDDGPAYRNPHCALCNHLTINAIGCGVNILSRKKPFSFALLLDVNQSDGDQVGVSRPRGEVCGPNQKYDPYFKKCRNLVCALPGYQMVNGRCKKPT